MANTFKEQCAKCSWASNWKSSPDDLIFQSPSFQYIPMLRDTNVMSSWAANVQAALSGGSRALFSFNEPDVQDEKAGSNLPVAAAVEQHALYMRQFVGKALIGSPAVSSNLDAGYGLDWLRSFIDQCSRNPDCHFDFCSVHWYGQANQAEMLFQHLDNAHALCGEKPLWLTELGLHEDAGDPDAHPSDLDKCRFLSSVMPRLDSLNYLATYAFFMGRYPGETVLPDTSKSFGKAFASTEAPQNCA